MRGSSSTARMRKFDSTIIRILYHIQDRDQESIIFAPRPASAGQGASFIAHRSSLVAQVGPEPTTSVVVLPLVPGWATTSSPSAARVASLAAVALARAASLVAAARRSA